MPAFNASIKYEIDQNIYVMFMRLKAVSNKSISYEDFIQLFVPAEHRDLFRQIAPISRGYARSMIYAWPNEKSLRFQISEGHNMPPMPRETLLQPDAPEELVRSISEWTAHGGDASGDCGRVRAVVNILTEKCSKSQLRFLFPSILTILTMTDKSSLKDIAQELQDMKVPPRPIELPAGVVQACRKAAATVAMCALIPHDILEQKRDEGEVSVFVSEGAEYREPGLGTFRGVF